jgi:predicted AlkP superfamily phosphohydrolase/phosphomutase
VPDPRIIGPMSRTIFTPGADVITTRGRGAVVDVRATPSGKFVFGVEDADGEVSYFTEKAVRLAGVGDSATA